MSGADVDFARSLLLAKLSMQCYDTLSATQALAHANIGPGWAVLTNQLGVSSYIPSGPNADGQSQDGFFVNENASAYVAYNATTRTLVLVIRGSSTEDGGFFKDLADASFNQDAHFNKLKPLFDAFVAYAQGHDAQIDNLYITGHSLGGAMAEKFFEAYAGELTIRNGATGEAWWDLRASTVGSPGANIPQHVYADPRLEHFGQSDDPVFTGLVTAAGGYVYNGTLYDISLPAEGNPLSEHVGYYDSTSLKRIAASDIITKLAADHFDFSSRNTIDTASGAVVRGEFFSVLSDGLTSVPENAGDDWETTPRQYVLLDGNGNNTINATDRLEVADGGDGNDLIAGVRFAGGGNGNDTLTGTGYSDLLMGGAGADAISALDGYDALYGGLGADTLDGGAKDDRLWGDIETDDNPQGLSEANEADLLIGGDGNDTLHGGLGRDTLWGDGGNDQLFGGTSDDELHGGTGQDQLWGHAGVDKLYGDDGDDSLVGGDGDDSLYGGLGNDTLDGGAGKDRFEGGAGDDRYVDVDLAAGDVVIELAGQGTDSISRRGDIDLSAGSLANIENAEVLGDASATVKGNAANNIISGSSGNDTLYGYAGDDTLMGGAGVDSMVGGLGNDTYAVDRLDDKIVELAGEGMDTALSSVTFDLQTNAANVENLTLSGVADINGTGNAEGNILRGNTGNNALKGNAGNDLIFGDAGNDTLDGGTGQDTLYGGNGDDVYYVDQATDVTIEDGNDGGIDKVVTALAEWRLAAGIENLEFIDSAKPVNHKGYGNQLANLITGGAGNDSFLGGDGADTLIGGQGDDTLDGGAGADMLNGGAGSDSYYIDNIGDKIVDDAGIDTVYASIQYGLGEALENLVLTGSADVNGTGNAQANILRDNLGNNRLLGGEGDDTLSVSGGIDAVDGQDGDDLLVVDYGAATTAIGTATYYDYSPDGGWKWMRKFTELGDAPGRAVHSFGIERFRLSGGSGDDVLVTVDGDDTLAGGGGNDTLDSGRGVARIDGGAGTDHWLADLGSLGATQAVVLDLGAAGTTALGGGSSVAGIEQLSLATGAADDTITTLALALDDQLVTGDGNDTVKVLNGHDRVDGQGGDDLLVVDYGAATTAVITSTYYDYSPDGGWKWMRLFAADDRQVKTFGIERFNLTGGSGNDVLVTVENEDTVRGGAGDDLIDSGAGVAHIDGGVGVDRWQADLHTLDATQSVVLDLGATGTSTLGGGSTVAGIESLALSTGAGADRITTLSLALNDELVTGDGGDVVKVLNGHDRVDGQGGDDLLVVDYGAATTAVITSTYYDYSPDGGWKWMRLFAADDRQVNTFEIERFNITSGSGNDALVSWDGEDTLVSGAGDDTLNSGTGTAHIDGGTGTDRWLGSLGQLDASQAVVLDLNATGTSTLGGGSTVAGIESLVLSTGAGEDVITTLGLALNDELVTGDGGDVVKVLNGYDRVDGQGGDDLLVVDYGAVTTAVTTATYYDYSPDGGWKWMRLFTTDDRQVKTFEIERFNVTGGSGNDALASWDGEDTLTGGAGDDTLDSSTGTAHIDGGAGIDRWVGSLAHLGASQPVVLDLGAAGGSQLAGGSAVAGIEWLALTTGAGDDRITTLGLALDDVLVTGEGNDTITVAGGHDRIDGQGGDDLLVVDYGAATTAIGTATYYDYSPDGGWKWIRQFTADDRDVRAYDIDRYDLRGGSGNDTLSTGDGADTLRGGAGDDLLAGGGGADLFVFAGGGGTDTLADWSGEDLLRITGASFGTRVVTEGDGSALGKSQVQLSSADGVTTLHVGIDATAGADLHIRLGGLYTAGQLRLSGSDILLNHAPTAAGGTLVTAEDTARVLGLADFGFADADAGDALRSVSFTGLPGQGSLKLGDAAVKLGQVVTADDIAAGKLVFTPGANGNGSGYASLGFQASDGLLSSAPATLKVDVTPVADRPTAANGSFTTLEDKARAFTVADFGFRDGDAGDTLQSVTLATLPEAGRLLFNGYAVKAGKVVAAADIAAGKLVFAPAANANGAGYASLGFRVSDGTLDSASSYTLKINVTPVRDDLVLKGTSGDDLLRGDKIDVGSYDRLAGQGGNDSLWGGGGNDKLDGGAGSDKLYGEAGNDTLTGGAGQDELSGGLGADRFVFRSAADSGLTAATWDTITDFSHAEGDRIDLAAIDAKAASTASNDAFSFIGSAAFGANANGQLRWVYDAASNSCLVYASTDADAAPEFALRVLGVTSLAAGDFVL